MLNKSLSISNWHSGAESPRRIRISKTGVKVLTMKPHNTKTSLDLRVYVQTNSKPPFCIVIIQNDVNDCRRLGDFLKFGSWPMCRYHHPAPPLVSLTEISSVVVVSSLVSFPATSA